MPNHVNTKVAAANAKKAEAQAKKDAVKAADAERKEAAAWGSSGSAAVFEAAPHEFGVAFERHPRATHRRTTVEC